MKLNDKVALVTGAGRNIGEEIAKALAAEGARIAVVDLDETRAGEATARLTDAGSEAHAFIADVSDSAAVQKLIGDVASHFGRLDILVNNVAISDNKHVLDITEEDWDRVIRITLTAPFLMAKYAAQQMVDQGDGGIIVNLGSTSGHRGRGRAVAYSAAKGGVDNLTRALAVQLAPHGIRVNCVSPNKTGSPVGREEFDPTRPVNNLVQRPGEPTETAKAVLFLCTDDSSFVWGENIFVDGGVMAMEVT